MPLVSSAPAHLNPQKLWLFRSLMIGIALTVGLGVLEWYLHNQRSSVGSSDQLEPGMIEYDPVLGWRLQANWEGKHKNYDFSARYVIDGRGFRADTSWSQRSPTRPLTAVVGDSFVFGFGVNDDQTFVHRLDQAAPGGMAFANFAVPGFSTDQEALLLEREIIPLHPRRILLIVYLGNDLLDNPRSSPLQVKSAKPYFEVPPVGGLVLRNTPVPLRDGPAPAPEGLTQAVLGPDPAAWPLRTRLEQRFEVFRLVNQVLGAEEVPDSFFSSRFAPAVRLFDQILARIRHDCVEAGVELVIGTLAGRSYVELPGSLSAQYQEYFRTEVVRTAQRQDLRVIDIAAGLRARADSTSQPWYFPNDGHLTAAGHRVVADILFKALQ